MALALDGIKVLDLSMYQQGPMAASMLADMGADVIKIEAPDTGDLGRVNGDAYFNHLNRNKRGISLDLKNPAGREAFLRLADTADIFHNNMRPGVIERLNLTYAVLSARNPRIIVNNATGWGHLGPDAEALLGSFDGLAQARGGLYSVNQTVEAPPHGVPVPLADQVGSLVSAYGMLVALMERERSGVGQEVNSSLYGSQLWMQGFGITNAMWTGKNPVKRSRKSSPRTGVYDTNDGLLALQGGAPDRWWPDFCKVMNLPELDQGVYSKNALDAAWCEATYDRVAEVFATKSRDEWMKILSPRFHVQPVRNYLEVAQDPQAWANGYLVNVDEGEGKSRPSVGLPVHLSRTPGSIRHFAPAKGQHNEEVLIEVGYSPEEVARLAEAGAFGKPGAGSESSEAAGGGAGA
ncbi:MAG: CoA transferase [Dehalococcoidia bacterium]|nr:CoA transferase [Dehalococcoidia bacterium]